VVLDDFQGVALEYADWSVLDGVEVSTEREHHDDPDRLVEVLAGAEVVVVMRERTPVPESLLARLPDLRLLVTTGRRNASIDVDSARARGVTVCGTSSLSSPPAELTWALILGLARHVAAESAALRSAGPWQSTVGRDLAGAALGVVGLGRIGTAVARVGLAFGMDVVAWSPHLDDERATAAGVRRAGSLTELLSASDVTTLHLQLSDSTRGLLGRDELAAARPGSLLVNTARAGLVDTDAMVDALREGRLAGAGLDVYDVEPLPFDHPLRTLPTVLALPHLGYVTEANYRLFFTEVVEDVAAWLAGVPVRELT
jgi:phosphoglycerate dehydrogenase-like enzyme